MKLNLGSGSVTYPGFINVDIVRVPDITDIICDLNKFPWPFDDDSVEHIIANDVIEHLDDTPKVMSEIHRILDEGGIVDIRVPNVLTCPENAFTDPTHKKFFTHRSFEYWCINTPYGKQYSYYYTNKFNVINQVNDININLTLQKII